MPTPTPNENSNIAAIANAIAPLVTNSIINATGAKCGLDIDGSNKVARLRYLLTTLHLDARRQPSREFAIEHLVLEAHARAQSGAVEFPEDVLEEILAAARVLKWPIKALTRTDWRKAIKKGMAQQTPTMGAAASYGVQPPTRAREHPQALAEVKRLLSDAAVSPQERGRQLEYVVFDVLKTENLKPERTIVGPGEEVDLAFEIGDHQYLVECKWEKTAVGANVLRSFAGKISTRPPGVFGIVLSMNGFVDDCETYVTRGMQQNCIGMEAITFMYVLEGHVAWTEVVRSGVRNARRRRRFLVRWPDER